MEKCGETENLQKIHVFIMSENGVLSLKIANY